MATCQQGHDLAEFGYPWRSRVYCRECKRLSGAARRAKRRREPLGTLSPKLTARFEARIRKVKTTGCWLWTGAVRAADATNGGGYGRVWNGRKVEYAHRVSYVHYREPIPEGTELDHLCRNRSCVNPWHLETVTRSVNQRRGVGASARNARKTHCPHGHPYDDANTIITSQGSRVCRTCHRKGPRAGRPTHCRKGHELTPDNRVREGSGYRCKTCNRERCRRYWERRRAAQS